MIEMIEDMRAEYIENAVVKPRFLWLNHYDHEYFLKAIQGYCRVATTTNISSVKTFMDMEVRSRAWVPKGTAYMTHLDLESIEEMSSYSPTYAPFKYEDFSKEVMG